MRNGKVSHLGPQSWMTWQRRAVHVVNTKDDEHNAIKEPHDRDGPGKSGARTRAHCARSNLNREGGHKLLSRPRGTAT